MLDVKMQDALNNQVQKEMFSAYLYLSMESYFKSIDLDGFANFFRVQFREETDHALKFIDYINQKGGRVVLEQIEKPMTEFASPADVFKLAVEHEIYVTDLINSLSRLATEQGDFATLTFLQWFVNEQVEEVSTVERIYKKLKLSGDNPTALFMIDSELAARVYVPLGANQGA